MSDAEQDPSDGDDAGVRLDPGSPVPPYQQVREALQARVEAGTLAPGTRLPPVRRLASTLGCAPGTVARAYQELEALGVLETRGRGGTVVTGGGRERAARQAAAAYAEQVRALGVPDDQALDLVRRALGG